MCSAEPRASSLDFMLEVFDVVPTADEHRYVGTSDPGERAVVDGSQLLGQAIVAAQKSLPGQGVKAAHINLMRAADGSLPVELAVIVLHAGRSISTASVAVSQSGTLRAQALIRLAAPQPDFIRHEPARPAIDPAQAVPLRKYPMAGRELRLVGIEDHDDPAHVGPPELHVLARYARTPERDALAKALVAHLTGHFGLSAALRPHAGLGTALAHDTISTAVLSLSVVFHDPVAWSGWLLYAHDASHAGTGETFVAGRVTTEDGRLIASFTQEGMVRALSAARRNDIPVERRL